MSVVSSNKNKPGRPPSSLSSNLLASQSTIDSSDMLSVSSRQRQSKKDEVSFVHSSFERQ